MTVLGDNKAGSEIDNTDGRIYKDNWGIYWINCRNDETDGVCWEVIEFEVLIRLVEELMKLVVIFNETDYRFDELMAMRSLV